MAKQYAAFISYRHCPLDIAVATKLHKQIERFKIPKDLRREEQNNPGSIFTNWAGNPPERLVVFRDRDELPLSNDLTSDIFDALDNAKCLIVICTPDTPKSMWVRREINHFIEKHGRKRIITVLAAGTPEESIPKEITTRYADDGVTVLEEYEPLVAYLAADSRRKIMRNLSKELLRICVALLGCSYDSLRQRHRRRKMRQLMAIYGAAFAVALSFIGLLLNRNIEIRAQKQEVEAQKQEVEAQKQKVEEQKQEAENQRRMVQLRESELLTANAEQAMEMGNVRSALTDAVKALPKEGEEDRPYYAPAERVLMEALDVMGGAEDHVLLSDTILEQMSPISNLALSLDGAFAVTIDQYGVIHCFDTVTGQQLWTEIVSQEDELITTTSYLYIPEDGNSLICRYSGMLESRDLQTGQQLWSYEIEYDAAGYFIYDESQKQIAVIRAYYSAGNGNRLELEIISAATGEKCKSIELDLSETSQSRMIHNIYQMRLPTAGVFSDDGRYFACAFSRAHEDSGKEWLECFVVDLQENTVVTKYTQEIPYGNFYIARIIFGEDGLHIVMEVKDDTVAGSVVKLDWQNNALLWQTTTPAELKNYFYSNDLTTHVLYTNDVIFLGRFERIYAIDRQTGQILHTAQLPGSLSSFTAVSDGEFGFSLTDGTYAIGWYSMQYGFSLTTDSFLQVTTAVGEHSYLCPQGGGIIQLYIEEDYVAISISNNVRSGYLAFIPADNENQLVIRRPVILEKTIEPAFITLPVEASSVYCAGTDVRLLQDGTLLLGKFRYYDKDWNSRYFYMALDSETHEIKQFIEITSYSEEGLFFLKDGSGYLTHSGTGIVNLVQDGQETILVDKTDSYTTEDLQYRVKGMVSASSVYLQDDTVLTAVTDSQTLKILKDGTEVSSSPLPDSHKYQEDMEPGVQRNVCIGRNGYVATYLTWLLQPVSATDVAFYNTADGTWILPELESPLTNTDAIAFAETTPLVALVDADHMIRILDLQKGTEVTAFSLQLPCNSVLYMDFFEDDSYLVVKTKDAKVLIYDIATHEIVLQDQLGTRNSGKLTVWEDTDTQRLYILDSNQSGDNALCIDLRSWTVLARAEKVLCYIPQTNELYQIDSRIDITEPQLFIFRVPGTDVLVKRAQELLAAE